ncbi:hypothetical protein JXC34_01800 [Candidatus Woesearchaeota archaeon]|nr:hypothetical protein [Candidatus Woesearchaeota archaeon]
MIGSMFASDRYVKKQLQRIVAESLREERESLGSFLISSGYGPENDAWAEYHIWINDERNEFFLWKYNNDPLNQNIPSLSKDSFIHGCYNGHVTGSDVKKIIDTTEPIGCFGGIICLVSYVIPLLENPRRKKEKTLKALQETYKLMTSSGALEIIGYSGIQNPE